MDIETRLARLEAQNRFFKSLLILSALAAGAAAVRAASAVDEDVLSARKLVIRDAAGGQRAVLETFSGGVWLRMFDASGEARVSLAHSDAAVFANDKKAHPVTSLRLGRMNGGHAVALGMYRGKPSVKIMDADEDKPRWRMPPSDP